VSPGPAAPTPDGETPARRPVPFSEMGGDPACWAGLVEDWRDAAPVLSCAPAPATGPQEPGRGPAPGGRAPDERDEGPEPGRRAAGDQPGR
jgi:hypothetical protein